MRGSDVDAALHYLARMIEAGEDPRFIARRIVDARRPRTSAWPTRTALAIAVAAADAVQLDRHAGGAHPARRRRSCTSRRRRSRTPPTSASTRRSPTCARAGRARCPTHLRDAHYPGAKRLGHGKGYQYPHDADVGVVAQQYLPDELRGAATTSRPSHGNEREVSARLAKIRRIVAAAVMRAVRSRPVAGGAAP